MIRMLLTNMSLLFILLLLLVRFSKKHRISVGLLASLHGEGLQHHRSAFRSLICASVVLRRLGLDSPVLLQPAWPLRVRGRQSARQEVPELASRTPALPGRHTRFSAYSCGYKSTLSSTHSNLSGLVSVTDICGVVVRSGTAADMERNSRESLIIRYSANLAELTLSE